MSIAKKKKGFTIVELLIVIVVIGILAAITIVAFNGISSRARASSASSALSQAAKKIAVWQVDNPGVVPPDLATAGVNNTNDVSYQYTGSGATYCITATNSTVSYKITESTQPTAGGCAGHGTGGVAPITNLAVNPSAEVNGGWLSNSGIYPVAWDTAMKRTGLRSLSASNTDGSATILSIYAAGASNGSGFAISGGATFTATAYFRAEVANISYIRVAYRLGGVYTTLPSGPISTGTTSSWTQVSYTFTAPGGSDMLRVAVDVQGLSPAPAGTKGWVDDMMVTTGSTSYQYADGNSPNWVWGGTVNNSTSTGPPL